LDPLLEKATPFDLMMAARDSNIPGVAGQLNAAGDTIFTSSNDIARLTAREKNLVEVIDTLVSELPGSAGEQAAAGYKAELVTVRQQLADAKTAQSGAMDDIKKLVADQPAHDAFLARAEMHLTHQSSSNFPGNFQSMLGIRASTADFIERVTPLAAADRANRIEEFPKIVAKYEGEVASAKEQLAKHQAALEALAKNPPIQTVPTTP
jgi:hypothetical protein